MKNLIVYFMIYDMKDELLTMVKRVRFHRLSLVLCFGFFHVCLLGTQVAAQELSKEVPDGMEVVEVSTGYRMIVQEGTKVDEENGTISIEDTTVYTVRRFREIEQRLQKIEEQQTILMTRLEELQVTIEGERENQTEGNTTNNQDSNQILSTLEKLQATVSNLNASLKTVTNNLSEMTAQVNFSLETIRAELTEQK